MQQFSAAWAWSHFSHEWRVILLRSADIQAATAHTLADKHWHQYSQALQHKLGEVINGCIEQYNKRLAQGRHCVQSP